MCTILVLQVLGRVWYTCLLRSYNQAYIVHCLKPFILAHAGLLSIFQWQYCICAGPSKEIHKVRREEKIIRMTTFTETVLIGNNITLWVQMYSFGYIYNIIYLFLCIGYSFISFLHMLEDHFVSSWFYCFVGSASDGSVLKWCYTNLQLPLRQMGVQCQFWMCSETSRLWCTKEFLVDI